MTRQRKRRLSRQDLRDLGITPGRTVTRYGAEGRAEVRQVAPEAKPGRFLERGFTERTKDGELR